MTSLNRNSLFFAFLRWLFSVPSVFDGGRGKHTTKIKTVDENPPGNFYYFCFILLFVNPYYPMCLSVRRRRLEGYPKKKKTSYSPRDWYTTREVTAGRGRVLIFIHNPVHHFPPPHIVFCEWFFFYICPCTYTSNFHNAMRNRSNV